MKMKQTISQISGLSDAFFKNNATKKLMHLKFENFKRGCVLFARSEALTVRRGEKSRTKVRT